MPLAQKLIMRKTIIATRVVAISFVMMASVMSVVVRELMFASALIGTRDTDFHIHIKNDSHRTNHSIRSMLSIMCSLRSCCCECVPNIREVVLSKCVRCVTVDVGTMVACVLVENGLGPR